MHKLSAQSVLADERTTIEEISLRFAEKTLTAKVLRGHRSAGIADLPCNFESVAHRYAGCYIFASYSPSIYCTALHMHTVIVLM
jgi:hypothetical protein